MTRVKQKTFTCRSMENGSSHQRKHSTQGFPRDEVSDKQEVLFEDVSPSTAFSIRQLDIGQEFSGYIKRKEKWFVVYKIR